MEDTRQGLNGRREGILRVEKDREKGWRWSESAERRCLWSWSGPHVAPLRVVRVILQDKSFRSLSTSLHKLLAAHWLGSWMVMSVLVHGGTFLTFRLVISGTEC